ncbi:leucine-rich repeat protein [Prevotella nigrescens]|uniref:leucine-rich repeat domain-containing protein n=1 Tax=Prevotella nigrescens TaxID=28133 RepID=UPI00352C4C10
MKQTRLLLLLLLASLLPASTHAAVYGDKFIIDDYTYFISDVSKHEVYISNCTASGDVTLPSTVTDKNHIEWTVKGLIFGNFKNVTGITIPEGYTTIGINVFQHSQITTLNIPASVTTIERGPFMYTDKLQSITVASGNPNFTAENGVLYNKTKTELICYPKGKTDEDFTVPDGVTKIMGLAFFQNPNIKTVTLPTSVSELDPYTIAPFAGYSAFTDCASLTAINVKSGNPTFKSVDGVVYSADGETLAMYPSGKEMDPFVVPATTKHIAQSAFLYTKKLKNITISEGVEDIGAYAFKNSGIKSASIPASVTSISDGVFVNCSNLETVDVASANTAYSSVDGVVFNKTVTDLIYYPTAKAGEYTVPGTVTTIKQSSCEGAKKLTKMTLPPSVKKIEDSAFENSSLSELAFSGTSGLEYIGKRAFIWAHLTDITIPASVKIIDGAAFYGQNGNDDFDGNGLKTVTVEDNSQLEEIGGEAFRGNHKLEKFEFKGTSKLKIIGGSAFKNNYSLPSFTFPETITSIYESAFNGCSSMKSATFKEPSSFVAVGDGSFQNCGLESLTLPSSVTKIGQSAFNNCDKLVSINLPATTTNVNPRAFQFCTSLTSINVDDANTKYSSVDGMLLSKNKETLQIFPPGKANDEFTLLPPSITTIGEYAFYYCKNLKNVTIPNKVTKIEKAAFQLCDNLNTITFLCDNMINPANIAQGGNDRAFDDGTSGSKNIFPLIDINVRKEKLAEYQGNSYYTKFKNIVPSFEDGKEEYIAVSDNAVDLLSTTTTDHTYVLPRKVEKGGKTYKVALVGDYLFQNVSNKVKEVVVFDNVRYIGSRAFMTGTDLTQDASTVENLFFIESTPTDQMLSTTRFRLRPSDLGGSTSNLYNEIASTTNVYVKKSALATYQAQWKDYASKISYKIPDVKISTKYGTFAREFDTDFSEYKKEKGNSDVAAFVAGSPIKNRRW